MGPSYACLFTGCVGHIFQNKPSILTSTTSPIRVPMQNSSISSSSPPCLCLDHVWHLSFLKQKKTQIAGSGSICGDNGPHRRSIISSLLQSKEENWPKKWSDHFPPQMLRDLLSSSTSLSAEVSIMCTVSILFTPSSLLEVITPRNLLFKIPWISEPLFPWSFQLIYRRRAWIVVLLLHFG